MSYCASYYGCSTSACTAGCGSGCSGGCRQISSGACSCSGFCTGGCYNGCANTCQGCSGCGSGCAGSCSGCGSGCASGCSGCGSGCATGCSGCGSGCANGCSGCGSGCGSSCTGCGSGCANGCSGCGSGCASTTSGGSSGGGLGWSHLGSGSSSTSVSFSLYAEVGYYVFTATTSGTLTVYTTGSSDTVGWLTDGGCGLSDSSGNSILTGGVKYVYDDDSGTNSNFRYSISISAGQYEIDVAQYGAGSCSGTLVIQWSPSGGGSSGSMSWKSLGSGNSTTTISFSLSANYVGYYSYTAPASGTLTVYTEGSYDTVGWLTDGTCGLSKSSGNSILTGGVKYTYNDDSGTNSNFSYTYNVTAGTTYEIDVAQFSAGACSGTLYIIGPATGWQTPSLLYAIGSTTTSISGTHSCAANRAGYFRFTTPSRAGKMVFQTTSGATNPDYYSYLSNTVLSGNSSSTSRSASVTGTILTQDDDGGAAGYDTLISYAAAPNTNYYWYVNAAYSSTGTLSIPWSFRYYRQFTLKFNANGGSGAPGAISRYEDSPAATIPSTQPTRTNYTFLGWSTSSTATSPTYYANGSINITSDITLYAVWKSNSKTITYNANGGSGAPAAQTFTSSTATISTTRPTYANKVFKGWSTSSSSLTPTYLPGVSYSFSSSVTLYAVWWPQFTWVTETATQARVLVSYIATYMSKTASNVYAGDIYLDDWYNEIAQILSMTYKVSLGQILTRADMQKLADAWNTPA